MTQPEARISRKIVQAMNADGHYAFKVWGNEMQPAGLPDILVCVAPGGWYVGLETKMPRSRGDVSKIQEHRHGQIRRAGGFVTVVCSVAEARRVIADFLLLKV